MKRIPMRSGCLMPRNLRLSGLILALALGFTTLPSLANMSAPTNGRIHGRLPDVTGTPVILMPDGDTKITNNVHVDWNYSPNNFTLAPLMPGLTYSDEDGDVPLGTGISPAKPTGGTWTWKNGATTLTAAQMVNSFRNQFPDGTVLTVSASASVNVSSVTGLPNTGLQTITTPTYNVVVRQPATPMIYANYRNVHINAGFPKTGFEGANFQFYMNGTNTTINDRYTYTTNQPGWTTVSATGVVTFTRMPTSEERTVSISYTDKAGFGTTQYYTFTVNHWFVSGGLTYVTPLQVDSYCESLGDGLTVPSHSILTNSNVDFEGKRNDDGTLYGDWGPLLWVVPSKWDNGYYWTSTHAGAPTEHNRVYHRQFDGRSSSLFPELYPTYVFPNARAVCVRAI